MNAALDCAKGYCFVGKGYKPLCVTKQGLLTWRRHRLYLFDGNDRFAPLCEFACSMKEKVMESIRLLERLARSEPQSAVSVDDEVYIARRHDVCKLDLTTGNVPENYPYRKPYIHTNRLDIIHGVHGFQNSVVYGEYLSNPKREEVCVYQKRIDSTGGFEEVYRFHAGSIRHIHGLVADAAHECVYILTGDEDGESGIWRATENFAKVEPMLVGDQQYRACIAFVRGTSIIYATDIPSRMNSIGGYDLQEKKYTHLMQLPGTCTRGCSMGEKHIFSTSVETVEPKSRGKRDMLAYWLSRKRAAGIVDDYPRMYMEDENGGFQEILKLKKDLWPSGAFRFGHVLPVYDAQKERLYIYPTAVKRYDGKLYAISAKKLREGVNGSK